MSNLYGFDFLKSEHTLGDTKEENETQPLPYQSHAQKSTPQIPPPNVANKSDLEKQFDVIQFLQSHRSSGCLPPSIIYKSLGIDLSSGPDGDGRDEAVTKMLLQNSKIRVEEIPDPENPSSTIYTFGYQAKFNNVHNKVGLLAQINRSKYGVRWRDLMDSYEGVDKDLDALITSGDIIAVLNNDDKDKILFPRGEAFLVELDGHVTFTDPSKSEINVTKNPESTNTNNTTITNSNDANDQNSSPTQPTNETDEVTTADKVILEAIQKAQHEKENQSKQRANPYIADIDINPKTQVRRGEAVWIGGQWFRISSAVKEGVPLHEQPVRAQAPPTVTLRKDLSKKNESDGYIRPFSESQIPLDHELVKSSIDNLQLAKEAREKLHKLSAGTTGRGVSGGAIAQLLSSNASASNAETLAQAFSSHTSSVMGNMKHRKPSSTGRHISSSHPSNQKAVLEQIEETKKAATDPNLIYSHVRRHGCTIDVRDMYLATKADIPTPDQEVEIYNMMVKYKLLEPNELMRRPRMTKAMNSNLGEDGKPKKRRYYERKGQRITNTHLIGTEIGAALARAAEKQQQGKSVGDGGM